MRRLLVLGSICLAYAALASVGVGRPFLRHHEGICATHAMQARSYLFHGPAKLRLGLLELGGRDLSAYEDWRDGFYPNRPIVSVVGPAVFFATFGVHEAVFRINLILVGCATILIFAAVARRLVAEPWDLVAAAFMGLVPIFTYFSHVATHLTYVLPFSLLAWYANLRWEDGRRFKVLLFAALFLACHSDWPGYFAAISIAAHRFRGLKSPLSYAVLGSAALFFGLHLLHLLWIVPDGSLIKKYLIAGADRSFLVSPSPLQYAAEEARELVALFTGGVLALAATGVASWVRRKFTTPLFLALLGLEEVVFTYLAYHHDFLTYPLTAFFALAAAEGGSVLWRTKRLRPVAAALFLAFLIQSVWVSIALHTRPAAYGFHWFASAAIRDATAESDRVLLLVADHKRLTSFYSERCVASRERHDARLSVRYGGTSVRLESPEDVRRYVEREHGRYDVIVAGDSEALRRQPDWLGGLPFPADPAAEGFFGPEDPMIRTLEGIAGRPERRGPLLFYRSGKVRSEPK